MIKIIIINFYFVNIHCILAWSLGQTENLAMEERLLILLAVVYWCCVGVRSQLSSCTFESGRGRIDLTALGNPDGVKARQVNNN